MTSLKRLVSMGLIGLGALAILIVGLWGYTEVSLHRTLRWLERADPAKEARAAVARGDRRLVAVQGIGLAVPGVPDFYLRYDHYLRNNGVRVIPFTSDAVRSDAEQRLDSLAVVYARRYNPIVLGVVQ